MAKLPLNRETLAYEGVLEGYADKLRALTQNLPPNTGPADPSQFNTTTAPVPITAPFLDPNAGRPPRQYQWSAGFQREIFQNMAVDAYYVGNRGIWWQSPVLDNINANSPARLAALARWPDRKAFLFRRCCRRRDVSTLR